MPADSKKEPALEKNTDTKTLIPYSSYNHKESESQVHKFTLFFILHIVDCG